MIRHGTPVSGLALACVLASCASSAPPSPAETPKPVPTGQPVSAHRRDGVASISLEDFFALHQSGQALIFDARAGFFYNLEHIPGALNMPTNRCDTQIAARKVEIESALSAGKTIVVYCSRVTCPDARTVAYHLAGAGYPAKIFPGGLDAWKDASLPVE